MIKRRSLKRSEYKPAVKLHSTRQAEAVQEVFLTKLEEIKQSAESQNHAIALFNELVEKTLSASGHDKEVLSGIRTALNKEMFTLSGSTGINFKADYGQLQTLKDDPDIGEMIVCLENWLIKLDDLILKPLNPPETPDGSSEITLTTRKIPVKSQGKIVDYIYLEERNFSSWQVSEKPVVASVPEEVTRPFRPLTSKEQAVLSLQEKLFSKAANAKINWYIQYGDGSDYGWTINRSWEVENYLDATDKLLWQEVQEKLMAMKQQSLRP